MKDATTDRPLFAIPDVRACRIAGRVNRFVVKIELGGEMVRAHINNSGRLHEFLIAGREGFCFETRHTAKTDYRLFAVAENNGGAVIDTQIQMKAFETAVRKNLIPWLRGYTFLRRNTRLGNSLIDYLFQHEESPVYLEVKSAVLREGAYAKYPDCPTLRGQRHVEELIRWARKGGEAFVLFMAALPSAEGFKPYREADPRISDLLDKAGKKGVRVKAMGIYFRPVDSRVYLYDPDLPVFIPSRG